MTAFLTHRTEGLVNYIYSPRGILSWSNQTPSGGTAGHNLTAGPDGGGAYKIVINNSGQLRMNFRSSELSHRVLVTPGEIFTLLVDVYASRSLPNVCIETNYLSLDGSSLVWTKTSTFTLAEGWQTLRIQIGPVPSGASIVGIVQVLGGSATGDWVQPGDEIRGTKAMLVRGNYSGPYYEPNGPGWRWLGSDNSSPSIATLTDSQPQVIRNLVKLRSSSSWDGWFIGTTYQGSSVGKNVHPQTLFGKTARFYMVAAGSTALVDENLGYWDGTMSPDVVGGKIYTNSAWICSNRPLVFFLRTLYFDAAAQAGAVLSANVGQTVTLTPYRWTRIAQTTTAPTGALSQRLELRAIQASTPVLAVNDYWYLTGAMCTEGSALYSYADGSWPGWRWETSFPSASVGWSQSHLPEVINLHPNSKPSSITGYTASSGAGAGTIAYSAFGGINNGPYIRRTWTADVASVSIYSDVILHAGGYGAQILGTTSAVEPGETYSFRIMVRPSVTMTLCAQLQAITGSVGASVLTSSGVNQRGVPVACPANEWTTLEHKVTINQTTYGLRCDVDTGPSAFPVTSGTTLDVCQSMLVKGSILPEFYFDGDTTGAKWTGTVGDSASIIAR